MLFVQGCGSVNPYTEELEELEEEYKSGAIDWFEYFSRWYDLVRKMVVYYCNLILKKMCEWFPWVCDLISKNRGTNTTFNATQAEFFSTFFFTQKHDFA